MALVVWSAVFCVLRIVWQCLDRAVDGIISGTQCMQDGMGPTCARLKQAADNLIKEDEPRRAVSSPEETVRRPGQSIRGMSLGRSPPPLAPSSSNASSSGRRAMQLSAARTATPSGPPKRTATPSDNRDSGAAAIARSDTPRLRRPQNAAVSAPLPHDSPELDAARAQSRNSFSGGGHDADGWGSNWGDSQPGESPQTRAQKARRGVKSPSGWEDGWAIDDS